MAEEATLAPHLIAKPTEKASRNHAILLFEPLEYDTRIDVT